ncbi:MULTISPECIES: S41 family peptidase [Elizabethkingia]|uniref:S41 family peptidase n=1 Tax=Elizabethkingia TaxID=308865 RepID=UPI00209E99D1|nr:S41 family peptidase [Elizabethkingia sp. S0634]MCP1251352.1 S41 family peptidase [Elizabethkingia sp. S0634]
MKFINKLFFVSVTGAMLLISCNRNNPDPVEPEKAKEENDFVWRGLNSWYYWQEKVPELADSFKNSAQYVSTINSKTPDALFYSLLYQYGTIDRNSWIISDIDKQLANSNGVSKSNGMDFTIYSKVPNGDTKVGIVNYVVPNSPAYTAGIKRGDVITRVNGAILNNFNYGQLLSDSFSVTFAQSAIGDASSGVITTTGEKPAITLTAVDNLVEHAVAAQQVFTEGNKKIGYLVYNAFQNSNSELVTAFGNLKSQGVTDLILDLRYNGGGFVDTAVSLGGLITGQFSNSPFVIMDFNKKHLEENETKYLGSEAGSLNLSKIYVLTSGGTASASELTIDCLRRYISVITVGEETYGKFVGSNTIYDSPTMYSSAGRNLSHNWALQPITFAYYNKDRVAPQVGSKGGLLPNYVIQPAQYAGQLKEFGDRSDAALDSAIKLATGQLQPSAASVIASTKSRGAYSLASGADSFIASKRTMTPLGTDVYTKPKYK